MNRVVKVSVTLCLVLAFALSVIGFANGASTSKQLSTNFTLVNLGDTDANVSLSYVTTGGAAWDATKVFTVTANGGQKIVRQYLTSDPNAPATSGTGSAVISSDGQLAAVVQIQALNGQTPSSAAYSGFTAGSDTFYLPLVARRGTSGSGTNNSQIISQNTGDAATTVTVTFAALSSIYTPASFVKSQVVQPGASWYYDLDDEAGLTAPWFGSATVTADAGGKVAVISNLFQGSDILQSYNGFPASSATTTWYAPSFFSRLANGLNSPVTIQNLSGSTMTTGTVSLNCVPDATLTGATALTYTNATQIGDKGSYAWNPVSDATFPAGWFGSCKVTAPGSSVVFVQLRYVNGPWVTGSINANQAAAYEGISAAGTDKNVIIPLMAKNLANGFTTAATIQNLNPSVAANVTLTYIPTAGGSPIVVTSTIAGGSSLVQNLRTLSPGTMTDGWVGSLIVSGDQPLGSFVQLRYPAQATGDAYMAHNGFTKP